MPFKPSQTIQECLFPPEEPIKFEMHSLGRQVCMLELNLLISHFQPGTVLPPGRHLTVFMDCHSVEVRGRGRAERRDGGGAAGI